MKNVYFFLLLFSHSLKAQQIEYFYDSLNRIKEAIYSTQASIKFSYDENGNRVSHSINSLRCSLSDRTFYADTSNHNITSFSWEVDDGNGFIEIKDNENYKGAKTAVLHLLNIPTIWYGYSYRCLVTLNNNITAYNPWLSLTFVLHWKGTFNDAWENPLNWSCGVVPDANTDVIIDPLSSHFPVVYKGGVCRSLNTTPGTSVLIKNGVILKIMGKSL